MEEQNNLFKKLVFRLVKKHIAGSTSTSVLNVVRELNANGIHSTVTLLNDHVDDPTKARYNANAYIQFIKQLSRLHLNSDISLRLSQLGYWIDDELLEKNLKDIIEAAKSQDRMLWIENEVNLEMSDLLPIYKELKQNYSSIGLELVPRNNKSSLNSLISKKDIIKLRYPINYNGIESAEKTDKIKLYKDYISALLTKKINLTVYGHDLKFMDKVMVSGKDYKRNLIFEIPLGYDSKRIVKLQKSKINMSVYVPYGKDWIPYFANRLAEGRVKKIAITLLNGQKKGANLDAEKSGAKAS